MIYPLTGGLWDLSFPGPGINQCNQIKWTDGAIVADRMASNLLEKNTNEFWKDVNVKNKCKTPLPQTVEGVTGMEEVAEMWRGHFSAVLNCLNNERVDVASYNLACDTEENYCQWH